MIEAKSLSRYYGNFLAVEDVSFQIAKGEIVGLLGPNGAGKTTIMKMLTGFLEPTSGQAVIAGIDVAEQRLEAQQKIGYLPESAPVYKEMNVYQYLKLVCELHGIPAADESKLIASTLEKTQLKDRAFQQIGTLSKGYQQRVGVAQAIIHNPEVLILDEPTNGLDPAQIIEMRKLIKNLAKESTIILSTHIMQEVEAVCDRVLMIVKGKLAIDSKLRDLTSSAKLTLRSDAPRSELTTLLKTYSGVKNVRAGMADALSLELDPKIANSDELASQIAQGIFSKGWKLYSLAPEQRSLETVFKEATGHSL